MKILITGAKGQLGNKLIEVLKDDNELVLTDFDTMDITDAEATRKRISAEKPDLIIHAAAYTKVDQAEADRELAFKINATGTENVAKAAKNIDAPIIYISTDYVFDGEKTSPYLETDETLPVNYYGETKLAGEKFIQEICDKYYILRTAWLYGELPAGHPGSNFVETMLRLAKDRDELNVVDDQIGSPTYTGDLVRVIEQIVNGLQLTVLGNQTENRQLTTDSILPFGIYHISGEGETTWYKFAKKIFELTGALPSHPERFGNEQRVEGSRPYKLIKLNAITTDKYPTPAKRPKYSYLSKDKLKSEGVEVKPWKEGLSEYLSKR